MKRILSAIVLAMATLQVVAAPARKVIDNGGSGPYKAEAVSEKSLPNFVVYKPQNVKQAAKAEGAMPLLVFANGGCNDTSLPHEKMLNDLASYGYIVVALGEMQERIDDRKLNKSPNEDMIRAIDWAEQQNSSRKSAYYKSIAIDKVALGGQSCGGAQVLVNCGDPRVKSGIMLNSGIGNMEMSGANSKSLENLHCPILYIIGGEGDVAYANAIIDYANIGHVPVAFANQLRVGHGGTFHEPFGGSFSVMLRRWMDWQLKGKTQNADTFLKNDLQDFPDYTMQAKNFTEGDNKPFITREIHCKTRDGKDIWGMAYVPSCDNPKSKAINGKFPTVVMAHGYNGTHQEPEDYARCLAMQGVASYIFDFCGGGNHSRSEGKTTDMTIFTEQEQVEDITRELKQWHFVDSTRVALLGCSQGGLVSAVTAASNPEMFRALILVYPALLIPETAPRMLQQFDAHNGEPQDVMGMKLGRIYYEKINGLPVLDLIGKYKGRTFMVYGDKDGVIAGGTLDRARKRYAQCEVKVIPGGNHGFSNYLHHAQATSGIVKFVIDALR